MDREIIQIISHNAVIVKGSSNAQFVAFGKGIGFKKKEGMTIQQADIIQEYMMQPVSSSKSMSSRA